MPDHSVTRESLLSVLSDVADPETGRSVVHMEQVGKIAIEGSQVDVELGLTTWSSLLWEDTRKEVQNLLQAKLPAGTEVSVRIVEHSRPPEPIGEIGLTAKSVIAVGSGKGGVGKSTMAASLAYGLKTVALRSA